MLITSKGLLLTMKRLSLASLGTISILFGTSSFADAASLTTTEFSLTFNTPPANFNDQPIEICGFVGICEPGIKSIVPDINPGLPTPPQPYINDTGFNITSVFAQLPENRPEGPGIFVEGISNIFSEINISNDGQELLFTGGIISVNEVIFADFQTSPEADSALFITLTTIPEPSSLVGILFFGSLGTGLLFNKKQNKVKG
ncbi:MAG: hypothetical protein F6J86_25380 [Symploca sp. SIO1B1]|nr:hypothetical protein [Symploca sp. SIO1B1]